MKRSKIKIADEVHALSDIGTKPSIEYPIPYRSAPFTKRAVMRAIKKGSKNLVKDAMELAGFVLQARDGWLVKIYPNGEREKISLISHDRIDKTVPHKLKQDNDFLNHKPMGYD